MEVLRTFVVSGLFSLLRLFRRVFGIKVSAISGTDGVQLASKGPCLRGPWESGADKVLLSGVGQRKKKNFRWAFDPISESKHLIP